MADGIPLKDTDQDDLDFHNTLVENIHEAVCEDLALAFAVWVIVCDFRKRQDQELQRRLRSMTGEN